jgi:hypothetical protein
MIKYHNVEQGTDEWFDLRVCKMTASKAGTIQAQGKGLETYIKRLLAEKYSISQRENYSNSHIQRGIELEPFARKHYEEIHGVEIVEYGFVTNSKYKNVGVSPDGKIKGEKGLVEFKAPNDEKYFSMIVDDLPPDNDYIWQCQMQMLVMEHDFAILCNYNPNFKNIPMLELKIEKDEEKQEKLIEGFKLGNELIKKYEKQFLKNLTK